MIEPQITVIIPTRERCDVLEKSLRTVTAQDYDSLEIIVSDNFSRDDTAEIVRSANDSRIKYINTGKRVSMSKNWEFALSNVAGAGWVTIIGDDDGMLPGSLKKLAKIIQSTNVKAIRTSVCSYTWPSLTGKNFGRLSVPLKSEDEVRQSSLWLAKVLSGDAPYTQLPMLYNGGFVNMSVLKQIESITGSVYRSCNPDIYSAVAISSVLDRYVYSHEPLAINGASQHSTGTSYFAKPNSSVVSPADKFSSEGNIPFHQDIPLCDNGRIPKSLQAMVYESYLQSRRLRQNTQNDIHAEQLEVILATSGRHHFDIDKWGEKFARKYRLDYERVRAKARRKKLVLEMISLTQKIPRAMNLYEVGSTTEPIQDVYEASIAAAAIRANLPGRIRRLRRLVELVGKKVLK